MCISNKFNNLSTFYYSPTSGKWIDEPMSQFINSLLETICKTATITTTYGMEGWQNKTNISLRTRTNVLWMNICLQSWNCPVSEILTFSEDVSSRPSSSEIESRKLFYFIFFDNQKTSRWRATWGSLWWPGWRRVAAGSWCRQWWWPGSGINKWLERNGEIVLLTLMNILSLPWPASLIPSCSAK